MRSTIIPAQITTVEDKIAGSLNLTQLMLLMVPVIWTTIVYTLLAPAMHIVWYKVPVVLIVLIISLGLAIRVNGIVVFNWLFVFLSYTVRPKLYVFNKNDIYLKEVVLPAETIQGAQPSYKKHAGTIQSIHTVNIKDFLLLQRFMKRKRMKIRYRSNTKGGLNVAFEHV